MNLQRVYPTGRLALGFPVCRPATQVWLVSRRTTTRGRQGHCDDRPTGLSVLANNFVLQKTWQGIEYRGRTVTIYGQKCLRRI